MKPPTQAQIQEARDLLLFVQMSARDRSDMDDYRGACIALNWVLGVCDCGRVNRGDVCDCVDEFERLLVMIRAKADQAQAAYKHRTS